MSIGGNDLLALIENEHPKLGQYLRSYIVPAIQSRGRAGHVLATPTDKPGNVELQPLSSLVSGNNPKSATYVGTDSAGGIVAASTPAGGITQLTGDVSAGPGSGPQAAALAAVGTAGTYTKVMTDGKGRVASGTTLSAGDIPNIAESQVMGLTVDLAAKAPLASPGLTGTPTAPTATAGTNTTQIATTAFVEAAVAGSLTNPMTTIGDLIVGGTVSGGVATPTRLAAGTATYVLTSNGPGVAPTYQAAAGGGYTGPLYGMGGFGSGATGTLKATFASTGTITFGPLNPTTIDATRTVTTVAGHVYRIVFYYNTDTNFCLIQSGTSGGSSSGYFIGHDSVIYYVSGSSYTSTGGSGFGSSGSAPVASGYNAIMEIYLWVRGASNNRIWANTFGATWFGVNDTHTDFTTHALELGHTGGVSAAYVYDLGAVPTS